MSEKSFTLAHPPGYQCYDCQGCGDCCRGLFAIAVTPEERERIMGQGWERDPEMQGQSLFQRRGGRDFLVHHADGACVFLNEHGLCRIHARFGEPAKPLACRMYPFVFVPVGPEARVDIRFDCPAVAGNVGQSLANQRAAMKELLPLALPSAAVDLPAPPLCAGVRLAWPLLQRITQAFDRLLLTDTLDFTRRIVCCVNLSAMLYTPRIADLDARKLNELLDRAVSKLLTAVAADPLVRLAPTLTTALMFRQLLAPYGRADRYGEPARVGERLAVSLRLLGGRGQTPPLRPGFPALPFATLEQSFGLLDSAVAEPLWRYYRVHLESISFCGRTYYDQSFLDGFNALLLTFPLILWYARAFAVADGATALARAHLTRAISVVDHQHGRSPLLNVPSERFRRRMLGERSHLRSLVVWYGS